MCLILYIAFIYALPYDIKIFLFIIRDFNVFLNRKFLFSLLILFVYNSHAMEQAEGSIQRLPRDLIECIVRTSIGGLPCSKNFTSEACQYLSQNPDHVNKLKLVSKRFYYTVKNVSKFFE